MGNSDWYGKTHVMGVDPYDDPTYLKADMSEEEQEEGKYWDDLKKEHLALSSNAFPVSRALNNMPTAIPLNTSHKRLLMLFECKLLTFMDILDERDAVNMLKMAKSSDEDNIYVAYVALSKYTERRHHQYGHAYVNPKFRSKIYNEAEEGECYKHLKHLISLTR